MNSPRIEFHPVRSYSQFYKVRSNREAIRFRALERSKYTLFDGDWFSTNWELAPSAWDTISAHCEGPRLPMGWREGVRHHSRQSRTRGRGATLPDAGPH